MTIRKAALNNIGIGDIFHATGGEGGSYVCLALQIRSNAIFARRVTTQSVHWFDRVTGRDIDHPSVVIDSVARLPEPIRETMLGFDRKYREIEHRQAEDPGSQRKALRA